MKSKEKFCCPKCKKYINPLYMKPNCPHCNVNLLYYKMDSRLEQDAQRAEKEVNAVNRFLNMLKESSIASPLHIIRLVVFFLPLASMCLPMFWAGHKNVSLITLIMSIVNYGLDFNAMLGDLSYFFAVLSIVCVVVFSLVVIIGSLFSAGKNGYKRNVAFSVVNTVVLGILGILVCANGGMAMWGFYLTLFLYGLDFILHFLCEKDSKGKISTLVCVLLCVVVAVTSMAMPKPAKTITDYAGDDSDVRVVSFNVASAFGTKLEDTDSMQRCKRFSDEMRMSMPDLIGTQEINSLWVAELEKTLPEYQIYAVARGGDSSEENSEMNAVMWNTLEYTIVDEGTFWLSQTPDVESKYTYIDENGEEKSAGCNRICSYVVLDEIKTGRRLLFMNTHLDNSSEQARIFGVGVILEKMSELRSGYGNIPVILTGDFNEVEQDEAVKTVSTLLNNTTDPSKKKATYQSWGYRINSDEPIDYIFTTGNGKNYTVIDNLSNGYISDHFGIMTDIKL